MKQSKLLGLALVIYAVTMWGLVPVGMRSLLLEVSPQTALLLRIFPAGLFAAILLPFLPMRKLTRGHWLRLIAAALILCLLLPAWGTGVQAVALARPSTRDVARPVT